MNDGEWEFLISLMGEGEGHFDSFIPLLLKWLFQISKEKKALKPFGTKGHCSKFNNHDNQQEEPFGLTWQDNFESLNFQLVEKSECLKRLQKNTFENFSYHCLINEQQRGFWFSDLDQIFRNNFLFFSLIEFDQLT